MQKETELWLKYAEENLEAAHLLFENELYNSSLHNVQQAVEKALKSLLVEKNIPLKRTHSIFEIKTILEKNNIKINITDDECDFLDTIYLPTKYPIGTSIDYFLPDKNICRESLELAEEVIKFTKNYIK